jgi:two-component system NarL family sensor kinase
VAVDDRTAVIEPAVTGGAVPGWISLVDTTATRPRPGPPSVRRVVGRFVLANLIGMALLLAGSMWASREAATEEAIADAGRATDLLATVLVAPSIDDRLAAGDPQAVAALDRDVRDRLAAVGVLRVKIWTEEGRIVYSDEPRLIGSTFALAEDDRDALRDGVTRAELSDLGRPENRYERSAGRLLEVYRQIRTPGGQPLLLETYFSYRDATARQMEIWFTYAPIEMSALLALFLLQFPLAHRMIAQLRASQRERELLQQRALDTSTEERRRIAGSLHDGIVQDVSASALLVAGAADQLRDGSATGSAARIAEVLGQAALALRESVTSLRSLLVQIYPPNLERAGLSRALADLAARLRPRGIDVTLDVPDRLALPSETTSLLFRTAQEALLNVAKHARARTVAVTVSDCPDRIVLEVADDGVGFDPGATGRAPRSGHLGMSLLADLAAAEGARLALRTAPGAGTALRLEVPRT